MDAPVAPGVTGLDAVVMAAGIGSRLRPLTERWPKPLLPVDGRPVIATLLRELAAAGFGTVTVVVGHLAEQIEALLGDGSAFGIRVRYARQPEPLGSAHAVSCALAAGARPPLLVVAADTVWTPGDIGAAAARWLASDAAGALAVRPVPGHELPERSSVRVRDGRLVELVAKPAEGAPGEALAGAPLWFLDEALAATLDDLPGPPFELGVAVQRAVDGGRVVLALDVGPTRDLTHPADVVRRNFPYLSKGP